MKVKSIQLHFQKILLSCTLFIMILSAKGQSFYFGADLSYVNEMEDCGADYKMNGIATDPYQIFNDQGANLIRLRLWHTPSWYDALNQGNRFSDFDDVRKSIIRAKEQGMKVLLDFHLSDTWADPGHQVAPAAWTPILDNLEILQDSLYNYIYSTLAALATDTLLPELVQIGNETNRGILLSQETNDAGWSLDWTRNSALFNTAISAVRDIEASFSSEIKVALHVANPTDAGWLMQGFWDHGVQDFDIIGLSYYWQFHSVLFDVVGNTITNLKDNYPGKEVMILETAYQWTNANADGANNILGSGYPGYTPVSPNHQKQWMIDLTQEVIDHGGIGVVYWEPAWVSTACSTQFGHGSHWDNATFFDFDDNLNGEGGIGWMTHPYDNLSAVIESEKDHFHFTIIQDGHEIWVLQNRNTSFSNTIRIQLYTLEGKCVFANRITPEWNENKYRVEISGLSSGCYILSITENNFFSASGFVIKY